MDQETQPIEVNEPAVNVEGESLEAQIDVAATEEEDSRQNPGDEPVVDDGQGMKEELDKEVPDATPSPAQQKGAHGGDKILDDLTKTPPTRSRGEQNILPTTNQTETMEIDDETAALRLKEKQTEIVQTLLRLKRDLIFKLKNPEKARENKLKETRLKKSSDNVDDFNIQDNGKFNLSEEEKQEEAQNQQENSISTFASLDVAYLNAGTFYERAFTQVDFKTPDSRKYCQKVGDMLKDFKQDLVSGQKQGTFLRRVDEQFFDFLYQFLVLNKIENAEIEIFFSFCNWMIDSNMKRILLTEGAFTKLFYQILLRYNPSKYTSVIYKALESCILFINSHLKILETDKFGTVKLIQNTRVIGYEALLTVHIYSQDESVVIDSKRMLQSILTTQIENMDAIQHIIVQDFINPIHLILEDEYKKLAVSRGSLKRIYSILKFIEESQNFITERLRISKVIKSASDKIGDASGVDPKGKTTTDYIFGFNDEITLKVNNTTFQKPPQFFEVRLLRSDTLRDLKQHIIEKLTRFNENYIGILSWGRNLYGNDRTLYEFGLRDKNVVIVMEKEYMTEMDTEMWIQDAHRNKVLQLKSIFSDVDEDFISYVLFKKKDVQDSAMIALTCNEKDKLFGEYAELQALKAKARNNVYNRVANSEVEGLGDDRIQALKEALSECDDFYDFLIKLLNLKNIDLSQKVWSLLSKLPAPKKLKEEISGEFFAEGVQVGENSPQKGSKILKTILSESTGNMACYYLATLEKSLSKYIQDAEKGPIFNFLFSGAPHLLFKIFSSKYNEVIKEFTELLGTEEAATKSRQEAETIQKSTMVMPILQIFHRLYDLALGSELMNRNSIRLDSARLNNLTFRNEIKDNEYEESVKSYNWDEVCAITRSLLDENNSNLIFGKLGELYTPILRCLWLNSFNLNANGNIIQLLETIFGLYEKQAKLRQLQGEEISPSLGLGYISELVKYFSQLCTSKSSNILSNLLLIHLRNFRQRISPVYKDLFEIVTTRGFFEVVPDNQFTVLKELADFLSNRHASTLKSSNQNPELTQSIASQYIQQLRALPKFQSINEENFDNVVANNFEGVINITKILLDSLQKLGGAQVVDQGDIEELYSRIVEPNLSQLFSEKPTVFYNCLSKGDSNLKNRFFEVCLIFCKFSDSYTLHILRYLGTVYTKKDFKQISFQQVGVRTAGEDIGLKNLGCTCYANSLFQQLFHNPRIRLAVMTSVPDGDQASQVVLHKVKQLFWRLKFTQMSHTMLDRFCGVFTGFDGMPINVRVQQDVHEFFNLLIDNLQVQYYESVKTTKSVEEAANDDVFNTEYGGEIVNIIESLEKDYPYLKERTEPFLVLSVSIKDRHNIYDSLDEFCSEEYFEGDNKLHIETYDRKVAVSKKILIRKLPPTVIFNLKRFEYDMKTWQRYKLNDFFEFPMELDLKKWCKFSSEEEAEATETNYKLKGVLIHSGTAQAGHYYSYIRIGEKWVEFNDTKVSQFEPSEVNLHREWFGEGKSGGAGDPMDRIGPNLGGSTCAYMLFYERVSISGQNGDACITEEVRSTEEWARLLDEIKEENELFIRKRIFGDSVSMRFLDDLLNAVDKDGVLDEVENLIFDMEKVRELEEEEKTKMAEEKAEEAEGVNDGGEVQDEGGMVEEKVGDGAEQVDAVQVGEVVDSAVLNNPAENVVPVVAPIGGGTGDGLLAVNPGDNPAQGSFLLGEDLDTSNILHLTAAVAEKAEDLQPVEQAIDLIDQAMDAAADMPEDNLVGFLDNNKDQIDSKKPKLDEETIKRNKETLKRVVKNQNLLDILVERNATILHKLAGRHDFLSHFLPEEGFGIDLKPVEFEMVTSDVAKGSNNNSGNVGNDIFGMDDQDVNLAIDMNNMVTEQAGQEIIQVNGGNDFLNDSLDYNGLGI